MDPDRLRALFQAVLPADFIAEAVERLGVQVRARALDPVALVISMVLVGGTAEAGRLAAVVRDYYDRGGKKVARSSYYSWFDEQMLALMKELSARTLAIVEAMPKHLPGILATRKDWRAVDSTVVRLEDALAAVYPGTGEYAALKVHKVYSLGAENIVGYHITPGRRHDAPELKIDESWRGHGLLVDLGYPSFDLLRDCQTFDVQVVARLKDGWNVYLDEGKSTELRSQWRGVPAGRKEGDPLELTEEEPVDVDVFVGPDHAKIHLRLVGVQNGKDYWLYLTTVPRETHTAEEVAMLYRLRWTIELDNKLAKTGCQLDEITAERPVSAEILVHASMIASMLANAIVHQDQISQGAVAAKTVRPKRGPLHAMLVWKIVVVGASRTADELRTPGSDPKRWVNLASHLTHSAADPNWRRKPSPMDLVKGRTTTGRAWRGGPKAASARRAAA